MNANVKRCVVRGAVVGIVVLCPFWSLGIEERFLLSGLFALLWIAEPLWKSVSGHPDEHRTVEPSNSRTTERRGPRFKVQGSKFGGSIVIQKAVAWVVAMALICAPLEARAQAGPPPGNGEDFTLLEGLLAVGIVVLTGYGYYHYYAKAKLQTKKLGEKKKKQIEETNPWPEDPPQTTNSLRAGVEYGAVYCDAFAASPEDGLDVEGAFPVISWVTPAAGELAVLRVYFPTNLIAFEDFLAGHGLSDSTNANFSVNGVPTSSAPAMFAYTNGTLTFTGTGNRTCGLQRSADLAQWVTIFRVSAPAGTRNHFADGTRPPVGQAFYRVVGP